MAKKQNKENINIKLEGTEELQSVEQVEEEMKEVNVEIEEEEQEQEQEDVINESTKEVTNTITKENTFFILDKMLGLVMNEKDSVEKDVIIRMINDLIRRLNILFN